MHPNSAAPQAELFFMLSGANPPLFSSSSTLFTLSLIHSAPLFLLSLLHVTSYFNIFDFNHFHLVLFQRSCWDRDLTTLESSCSSDQSRLWWNIYKMSTEVCSMVQSHGAVEEWKREISFLWTHWTGKTLTVYDQLSCRHWSGSV